MTKGVKFFAVAVGLATSQSCAVHQTEAPPLAGPSELAQSVTITASPDTLKLGTSATARGESATVVVQVRGPDGSAQVGKSVRLDVYVTVGGFVSDCGILAQHDLFTSSDGRATTVFTAPGSPLPQPECSNFSPGGSITLVARVADSNYQTSVSHSASIRMIPSSVITSPGAPVVNFTVFPNPASPLTPVAFTDAGSTAGPGRTITSYRWDFSDGATKTGPAVTHDFIASGNYMATLTVTDDIGQQTFKSAVVVIVP